MKKVKTLDFTPYSQADVNVLLAAVPIVDEKIKAYEVNSWFNATTKETSFGISCKGDDGKWRFVCDGKRALIFSDKKMSNAVCRHFKKGLVAAVV